MARIELLIPHILKWEGGFTNDPVDKGGATNKGVTLETWGYVGYDKNDDGIIDEKDLKLITDEEAVNVVLRRYWDRWQADKIDSQKVANMLVDWTFNSGSYGLTIPQRILGVTVDGIVGKETLKAVNEADPDELFDKLYKARVDFYNDIVNRSVTAYQKRIGRKASEKELLKYTQKRFLKGWLNRVNDLKNA